MNRYLLIFFLLITNGLCFPLPMHAQSVEGKQLMVVMRAIGHHTLLLHNDSTSRVLPVQKEAKHQYKISFDSPFQFNPALLATTIDSVVKSGGITADYIVEVQNNNTNEITYSFQVEGEVNADIIPCGTRFPPKAHYNLIFTVLNKNGLNHFVQAHPIGIILIIVLITTGTYFTIKRKQPAVENPDVVTIGNYKLDKRNMLLSFEETETMLSSKEVDLLALLHESVNQTLDREAILKAVWEDEGNYIGRTLDVFISKLRKKLEADPNVKIVNIRGIGYKLIVNDGG
jgi:hypothetical protein